MAEKDMTLGEDLDHVNLLFPSEYLATADLKGREVPVTIAKVTLRDLRKKDNTTERKPIVHLEGKRKKWVLNKTNATAIADLYGPKPTEWAGKRILIYPTTCQAFGKTVECIRVRDQKFPD